MSFILLGILNSQAAGAVGGGSYDLLETTVLGSDTASIEFTGLGSYTDYKHLQIRAAVRNARASGDDQLSITFNSVTTSEYAWHRLIGDGSNVSSASAASQTAGQFAIIPSANQTTGHYGPVVADILDFSSASKNTTVRSLNGYSSIIGLHSVLFASTAAITSIELEGLQGNLVTGSRFSLYGIKAGA